MFKWDHKIENKNKMNKKISRNPCTCTDVYLNLKVKTKINKI